MNKPDGGQAFPVPGFSDVYGDGSTAHRQPTDGMTLRDFFAAAALSGMLADPNVTGKSEVVAKACYQYADAMIVERSQP